MKKRIYLLSSVITLLVIGVVLLWSDEISKAAGGAFGLTNVVSKPSAQNGEAISTTTLQYMTIGAGTTTVTVNTRGTEALKVNVFVHAFREWFNQR